MIKNKTFLWLIGLLLIVSASAEPQDAVRQFDQQAMNSYAEQSDFDYMNYTVKPPSIWERVSWWFQNLLQQLFLNPNTPWLTRIAYFLILLFVLGAAIFYIVRLRYGGGMATDYQRYAGSIPHLKATGQEDFEAMIDEAVQQQNFNLAIRYLYLQTLLTLSNKQLIKLKDWKSPYDYQRELKKEMVPPYMEIAKLFEYIWYGDFRAGEEEFKKGKALYSQLIGIQ